MGNKALNKHLARYKLLLIVLVSSTLLSAGVDVSFAMERSGVDLVLGVKGTFLAEFFDRMRRCRLYKIQLQNDYNSAYNSQVEFLPGETQGTVILKIYAGLCNDTNLPAEMIHADLA